MPTLMLMNDGAQLRHMPLFEPETRVGRAVENHIVIYSRRVSRFHALLIRHGGFVSVRDLQSTNGTFVNGKRVAVSALVDGDTLQVGDVLMRYFEAGDPDLPEAEAAPMASVAGAQRHPAPPGASVHVAWRMDEHIPASQRAEEQKDEALQTEHGLLDLPMEFHRVDHDAPTGGNRGAAWIGDAVGFTFSAKGRAVEGLITYEALADHFGASAHGLDADEQAVQVYLSNQVAINVAAALRYAETGREPVLLRTIHF